MITRKEIKKIILDKDTTAAAIAGRLGMTPQNFNSFMQKSFTQQDLGKIAAALGVRYLSAFVDENGNIIVGGIGETPVEDSDEK